MPSRFLILSLSALAVLLAGPAARAQDAALGTTASACVSGNANGFACNGVDLQARLPLSAFGPSAPESANEIWGWTDPADGREIALVGLANGVGFVDISVPTAPVYLGKLNSATSGQNTWRTLRTYRDHLFVGSEASGHGIQVFDLTRLRGVSAPQAFAADARYTGTSNTHTLVINEQTGFLYIAGGGQSNSAGCSGGGLHMVDIRNPLAPTFAGCFDDDGYTHEAQCLVYDGPDTEHAGKEICVAYNQDHVSFVDVTDKQNASVIGTAVYPNTGYTHQGWFTDDKRHILLNDEFDEVSGFFSRARTVILDVQDLDNATYSGQYLSSVGSIDHNLYVVGNYAFQSNYEAGLRILDVTDVATAALTEVGFFDTFPSSNNRQFNGQWMNYPFFASGNVVAADINNGLFVLKPTFNMVGGEDGAPASAFRLGAPTPNPFSGRTELALTVGRAQTVRAEVYDALGRRVATLLDRSLASGAAETLVFDGGALPPGVYVVRVTGETFAAARRVTLVR